jgi:hypothetical protein
MIAGHQEVVDLPLDGREFMHLALLSPGAAPIESPQQYSFAIPEGGASALRPMGRGAKGTTSPSMALKNNELFDKEAMPAAR